ncbi:MAG TPA: ABC transporter ATP-binding protein [Polyangiaceae bacterium]|nr:ABC transporter ATP-binding protein [Polyangiaceae bacterium]
MIEVQGLTKDYGTVIAVRDVSFSVGRGEVVGFLGPNGAGKSTTLRILAGFLGATSGKVTIGGFDIAERSLEARAQLGYMPEAAPLYPELRVREYLEFRARLKRVPRGKRRAQVAKALERAHVTDMAETTIGHLSKGYRQRVGLADALVADPPLLILDEPTAGLDPNQVREVRALIQELSSDHTVLLSTHILSEVEATCQRALVIDRGRLVAQGTLAELARGRRSSTLLVVVRDPEARAAGILGEQPYVTGLTPDASAALENGYTRLRITLAENENALAAGERLLQTLHAANVAVASLTPEIASLEQTFADLTQDQDENGAETP